MLDMNKVYSNISFFVHIIEMIISFNGLKLFLGINENLFTRE